jgi:ABC-type Mn2+/Zn2+ transport system permease subunit
MSIELEIQLVAVVVAVACALPGVFLVLRRMALMSDAISHTVLLGIVLAFFITGDIASPLLMFGAAAMGCATVALVELLRRTRLVREDAAIGLVFPALFSIAVILISRYAGHVHLDTDAVLLGEIAFAPFRRLESGRRGPGPAHALGDGRVLLLNLAVHRAVLQGAEAVHVRPGPGRGARLLAGLLHYAFMTLVSITAVGAFDAVGSILVVALMIAPPATAYLLTDRLPRVLLLSVVIGAGSARSPGSGPRGSSTPPSPAAWRRWPASAVPARVPLRARAGRRGGRAAARAAALGVRATHARHPPAAPRGRSRGGRREPRGAPRRAPALEAGLRAARGPRGRGGRSARALPDGRLELTDAGRDAARKAMVV